MKHQNPNIISSKESLTSKENKNYIEGGTTPNSKIIVRKTNNKYFLQTILFGTAIFICYKTFLNNKKK